MSSLSLLLSPPLQWSLGYEHCDVRLPRLRLSRRVRFTNPFTEQAIELQFPYPARPSAAAILGLRTVSGFARQRQIPSCPTLSRSAQPSLPSPGLR